MGKTDQEQKKLSSEKIRHQEVIDAIIELAKKSFPNQGKESTVASKSQNGQGFDIGIEPYIMQYYEHAPLGEFEAESATDLFGAALSLWRFAKDYNPERQLLRIFNPRPEIHGWHNNHSVLEIVMKDMPFLVDSVCQAMAERGISIHRLIHPVIKMADERRISIMHIEIDRLSDPNQMKALENDIEDSLKDVSLCVRDWKKMCAKAEEAGTILDKVAKSLDDNDTALKHDLTEAKAFLDWLNNNHFTHLGYRELEYKGKDKDKSWAIVTNSGLGIIENENRKVFEGLLNTTGLPDDIRNMVMLDDTVRVFKATSRSKVHRRSHLDVILIKNYGVNDKSGKLEIIGERMFAGLFTSNVYSQEATSIPFLRGKIARIVKNMGFAPSGHDAKALDHVLETYPRDELFQISEEDLVHNARNIVHLGQRPQPAVFLRKDPFERYVTALTFLPRERFSSELRKKVSDMLCRAVNGTFSSYTTQLSENPLAQVLYVIKTQPGKIAEVDNATLKKALHDVCRGWSDRLKEALQDRFGEEIGNQLCQRYGQGFPTGYQELTSIPVAIHDIEEMELLQKARTSQALSGSNISVNLYQPVDMDTNRLRLKIYRHSHIVVLSEIIPVLENMGLRVIEERPWHINLNPNATMNRLNSDDLGVGGDNDKIYIHDFGMEITDKQAIDIDQVRGLFHDALTAIWENLAENDGFNRLVLAAGLNWRQITVIRAYAKYLQQASIPFSQYYMQATFMNNPEIIRNLAKLFIERFDPSLDKEVQANSQDAINSLIEKELETVQSLDEDRILRRFHNLINSTIRTNYFQTNEDGSLKSWLSFKFDSRKVIDLPEPAPYREIFVYSTRFEAVHLRFGLVARGGLRWSDRREDFRTEVLGLVKAQQVKNAVIVPVGSKGGFVLKQAFGLARPEFMAEGVSCYKSFITAMLEITDNILHGEIVPPKNLLRHDGDDPYLVVAADKGTATFSDYANSVSVAHGFWLGDAFASGGSAGYDHKVMGITAKGAWEAVKRHFREIGHDTQSQDFTVIGVGDMAGDVFGNGMILSKHIRLQAAFNHMHIFIDPNPDAAATFQERVRLFNEVQGWASYNKELLSKGGGIFERSMKSIPLSPEIMAMLDTKQEKMAPNELIRHILLFKADLLWFGGIGTYVKHSKETNAEVGDRANDAIRINGNQIRSKVIGEGANLGMTQLARVEFALKGGALNTDAIDNSAGVDCSDHEVNIKILLGKVVEGGDMTQKQRNAVLVEMTDDVAKLVLRDNYQQSGSLSVCRSVATQHLDRHHRLIRSLERSGHLNRALEYLPNEEEFEERSQQKLGLVRPELAVLLAYAKNVTYQQILSSHLPDDEWLAQDLKLYFPTLLQQRFKTELEGHKLRREIIATSITNSMINRSGLDFISEAHINSGASADEIARAYLIVRDVFDLRKIWTAIEANDGLIDAKLQSRMVYETRRTIERMTSWLLRYHQPISDIRAMIEKYSPGVREYGQNIEKILPETAVMELAQRSQSFMGENVTQALADQVGRLKVLSTACDLVRLQELNPTWSITALGKSYSRIGARFSLDRLRSAANRLQDGESSWNRLALSSVIDDLWSLQFTLTRKITEACQTDCDEPLEMWLQSYDKQSSRVDLLLGDLLTLPKLDLAMLSVAVRELRAFIGE